MVEQHQAQRRGSLLGGVRPTSEDHRATPFELFFDLVYETTLYAQARRNLRDT